jgi:hypothetical protein
LKVFLESGNKEKEGGMGIHRDGFRKMGIALFLAILFSIADGALAQTISPAQEQEFLSAKKALEAAQKAGADKVASEPLEKARDLLIAAENARIFQDGVKFTQASRLARAYAELAKAMADLKTEEGKLAATQEALERAQAELERLKQSAL